MTRDEVFQALDEVFQEEFDDDSIHVTETTVASDIEDWDSLEHINLIIAIEKRFKMRFSMGEVTGLKNVGEMVEIILKRGA
jgi:acyl carrier protein